GPNIACQNGRLVLYSAGKLVDIFGLGPGFRAIPIVEPKQVHKVGLVVAERTPMSPLVHAMFSMAAERKLVL
ncbi:MAG TPA: hypothetical protein PLY97_05615, partial [Acidocella sp.]|nr:hypothetical protein [Acidocella sp.]